MKLSEAIEMYVRRKRNEGFLFECGSKTLSTFCDQIGDFCLGEIKTQHISAFLDRRQISVTSWRVNPKPISMLFVPIISGTCQPAPER